MADPTEGPGGERAGVHRVVLVRHGESAFNADNRFTGWLDPPLTPLGVEEARRAGRLLRRSGFRFDRIYSSVLIRCLESARIMRDQLGTSDVPIVMSWRLNERHYGALQGLNKTETSARFGEAQVDVWRRSYDVAPPPGTPEANRDLRSDPRYAGVDVPLTESLADTLARVLPCWRDEIAPAVRAGLSVLIVAHGNSLRALRKYLDAISDSDIVALHIPTGIPQVYELTDDIQPVRRYELRDAP